MVYDSTGLKGSSLKLEIKVRGRNWSKSSIIQEFMVSKENPEFNKSPLWSWCGRGPQSQMLDHYNQIWKQSDTGTCLEGRRERMGTRSRLSHQVRLSRWPSLVWWMRDTIIPSGSHWCPLLWYLRTFSFIQKKNTRWRCCFLEWKGSPLSLTFTLLLPDSLNETHFRQHLNLLWK